VSYSGRKLTAALTLIAPATTAVRDGARKLVSREIEGRHVVDLSLATVDDIALELQKRPLQFALMVSHEQPWPALPPADVGPDATRVYGTGTDPLLHAWMFADGICTCLLKVTNLVPEFEKSPFAQMVLQLYRDTYKLRIGIENGSRDIPRDCSEGRS
jgi:hypothetical protein